MGSLVENHVVAKTLATNNGVRLMHGLPKLVANITGTSQFHHLVNTVLAVGSLFK